MNCPHWETIFKVCPYAEWVLVWKQTWCKIPWSWTRTIKLIWLWPLDTFVLTGEAIGHFELDQYSLYFCLISFCLFVEWVVKLIQPTELSIGNVTLLFLRRREGGWNSQWEQWEVYIYIYNINIVRGTHLFRWSFFLFPNIKRSLYICWVWWMGTPVKTISFLISCLNCILFWPSRCRSQGA